VTAPAAAARMCQKRRKSPWAGMTQDRNHPGQESPRMGDHTRDLDAAGKQITYTDLQTDKLAKALIG